METTCSNCKNEYDDNPENFINKNDKETSHLPIQSSKCEHYLCYSCLINLKNNEAQQKNKPINQIKWLKCPKCNENTSFNTQKPIVSTMLCIVLKQLRSTSSNNNNNNNSNSLTNTPTRPEKRLRTSPDENEGEIDTREATTTMGASATNGGLLQSPDVQVLSPPTRSRISVRNPYSKSPKSNNHGSSASTAATASNGTNNNSNDDDDDDEIIVESSNVTNANIHLPHARTNCGKYKFVDNDTTNNSTNKQFCYNCYCVKCDVKASECKNWSEHCNYQKPKQKSTDGTYIDPEDYESHGILGVSATTTTAAGGINTFLQQQLQQHFGQQQQQQQAINDDPYSWVPQSTRDYVLNNNRRQRQQQQELLRSRSRAGGGRYGRNNFYSIDSSDDDNNNSSSDRYNGTSERRHRDMRITEVLSKKLSESLNLSDLSSTNVTTTSNSSTISLIDNNDNNNNANNNSNKMDGDIKQLNLMSNSIFIEGIKMGWPFPSIMKPQRLMAIHIIKALKKRLHCVIESPTGTGKSIAILCSVLAWQRYYKKTINSNISNNNSSTATTTSSNTKPINVGSSSNNNNNEGGEEEREHERVPKIIYCSRTHSQVAQMVSSLLKTPYRVRMTVLGSRDRLCIHKELNNRSNGSDNDDDGNDDDDDDDDDGNNNFRNKNKKKKKKGNINLECQLRVANTEKIRKALYRSNDYHYDDDDPPPELQGDGKGESSSSQQQDGDDGDNNNNDDDDGDLTSSQAKSGSWIMSKSKKKLTCPHYRQLTSTRTTDMIRENFLVSQDSIDNCTVGGEHTKLGVHDVEDLVSFGLNPYVSKNVPIYRANKESFGMTLEQQQGGQRCIVKRIKKDSPAFNSKMIKANDRILSINNKDVRGWPLSDITSEIKQTQPGKPLMVDVLRHGDKVTNDDDDKPYQNHSACPYYISKELSKHAELIFCPYNYVLDPQIRDTLGITVDNAVIILDEAHNVEDTLKESGSGKFSEYDLYELVSTLVNYSGVASNVHRQVEVGALAEKMDLSIVAHELLLFVEHVIGFMTTSRQSFENSQGSNGASAAINDYKKFHTPDDKEFEVTFDGPNGYGVKGEASGCRPFFGKLNITEGQIKKLQEYAKAMDDELRGRESDDNATGAAVGDSTKGKLLDLLSDLIAKFSLAINSPEHFYISCVVQANGNLDWASGDVGRAISSRFKKKPKVLPFVRPRTQQHPNELPHICLHKNCRKRHGDYCNGSTPPWEAHLRVVLLSPGLIMSELTSSARSVVLASGSLAPMSSLCGELNLFPPKQPQKTLAGIKPNNNKSSEPSGRLQITPPPLEANHVVDLQKQLFAVGVGHFLDGSPLTTTYTNYKNPSFFTKLGRAIATVVESVPRGGVLIFLPSYSFLRKCIKCWKSYEDDEHSAPDVWDRFLRSKGKVVIEPTGSQAEFEAAKEDYTDQIKRTSNCILLAVFRGKMSEGISFNDDNARGVICVGLPLPNSFDRSIKAKRDYNDEQRKFKGRTTLLPGNEWYFQQAYRAIAQALGRCIRHAADYGTVVLMDSRHCDDGAPIDGVCSRAHQKLPKWMRNNVKTLSMRNNAGRQNAALVGGGYRGLKNELSAFFSNASIHSSKVIEQQQTSFAKAQEARRGQQVEHSFDSKTGMWSQSQSSCLSQSPMPSTSSSCGGSCNGGGISLAASSQGTPLVPTSQPDVIPGRSSKQVYLPTKKEAQTDENKPENTADVI